MNNYYEAYRPHGEKALLMLYRRPLIAASSIIGLILLLSLYSRQSLRSASLPSGQYAQGPWQFDGYWNFYRDRNNLMLDNAQCEVAFPSLFDEVKRAVEERRHKHVTVDELDSIVPKNGYVRAMIYDQEVSRN